MNEAALRAKALLALGEGTQECRYGPVRGTFAIHFALAYLWSLAPADSGPFDQCWKALSETHMWRFSSADRASIEKYQQLGLARDDDLTMRMEAVPGRAAGHAEAIAGGMPARPSLNVDQDDCALLLLRRRLALPAERFDACFILTAAAGATPRPDQILGLAEEHGLEADERLL